MQRGHELHAVEYILPHITDIHVKPLGRLASPGHTAPAAQCTGREDEVGVQEAGGAGGKGWQ